MNWSYIAGFIDGEGNIGLLHRRNTKRIEPYLKLINSNREVLEEIRKFVGFGTVRLNNKGGFKPNWRDTYVLIFSRRDHIKTILMNCINDLIVKRKQAELMLKFIEIREKKHKMGSPLKGKPRGSSTFDEEFKIYEEMKSLNIQRGKAHYK